MKLLKWGDQCKGEIHSLPIDFEITGGEVHDCKVAPEFFEKLPDADYMIADKGYDSEELRDIVRAKKSVPIIPRKSNSKTGNNDMDWGLYKSHIPHHSH